MSNPRWIHSQRLILFSLIAMLPIALAVILVSCGGLTSGMQSSGMGTIHLSLTDPPTCQAPNGNFQHVFVTIRSVQANINATADDTSSGWQELAPQLNSQPMQIDLFSTASTSCLLTTLGSNTALPAGTYQQIRLLLVPNSGGTGPTPTTNNCDSQGFNCVVLADNTIHELDLRSCQTQGLENSLPDRFLGRGRTGRRPQHRFQCLRIHHSGRKWTISLEAGADSGAGGHKTIRDQRSA